MIEVPLADPYYAAVFYETSEFAGGIDFEPFAEDEDVWNVCLFEGVVFSAVVESMFEIVRYEVGGFEEEIDIIRSRALHAVLLHADPCCVFGG